MSYRRRMLEDIPEEDTRIWFCTHKGCKGWMRDNFTFDSSPRCRLCNSPMDIGTRKLPALINTNGDPKALKKGISIQ
ncbi:cold-shock protein [Paenibacillus sp. 32O-W]|uniref:cold-shock protein n=1 Tax=Paenibacillus sp. 32O-W TaxID=1695218 RepID=UPI0011A1FDF9|nr:cold-shock protein [Paenibacillus sp. 32O-W]